MKAFLFVLGSTSPIWLMILALVASRSAKGWIKVVFASVALLVSLPVGMFLVMTSIEPTDPNLTNTPGVGVALIPGMAVWCLTAGAVALAFLVRLLMRRSRSARELEPKA